MKYTYRSRWGQYQLLDTCPPHRSVTPVPCSARESWTWRCLHILLKISWQRQQRCLLRAEIEVNQCCALPKHSCKALCTCWSYLIVPEIEVSELCVLWQYSYKVLCPGWSDLIPTGIEVSQRCFCVCTPGSFSAPTSLIWLYPRLRCTSAAHCPSTPPRISAPASPIWLYWCAPMSSLSLSICPSRPGDFFLRKICFFRIRDQYRVNRLLHPHFRADVQLNVCSLGCVIESSTLRSVVSACLSFDEPTNRWTGNRWTLSPVPTLAGEVVHRYRF